MIKRDEKKTSNQKNPFVRTILREKKRSHALGLPLGFKLDPKFDWQDKTFCKPIFNALAHTNAHTHTYIHVYVHSAVALQSIQVQGN